MLAVLILATGLVAPEAPGEAASRFLERCRDAKFAEAAGQFDAKAAQAVPAAKLGQVWGTIRSQLGEVRSFGAPKVEGERVTIRCTFAKGALDARFTFDAEGKVSGFRLVPPAPEPAPARASDAFTEEEVTVGAAGWPLGGTLTRPKGVATAPLVVLVHGSGPHDRDETIGPNAPFRDLARGLAAKGVAVLRYEKRTKAYAEKLVAEKVAVDVDSEVIDDALAAVAKGRTLPGVDPARVFVAGHSLGGSMAPAIAARDGKLAGLVLLAAAARPPDKIILDQFAYLAEHDPSQAEGLKLITPKVRETFARIRGGEAAATEMVLGTPAPYWTSWMARKPAEDAAALGGLPMLFLRGGRDYQVVEADEALFKEALTGRPNATFRVYPELNHLFQSGEGPGLPSEYMKAGTVDPRVVDDIAAFVRRRS